MSSYANYAQVISQYVPRTPLKYQSDIFTCSEENVMPLDENAHGWHFC